MSDRYRFLSRSCRSTNCPILRNRYRLPFYNDINDLTSSVNDDSVFLEDRFLGMIMYNDRMIRARRVYEMVFVLEHLRARCSPHRFNSSFQASCASFYDYCRAQQQQHDI